MKRFLLLSIVLMLASNGFSQNISLSDYSYVVIPEQFDFLKGKDQYQINSMTKFYFEKNGFNAYMATDTPNANRCDGLYANVEEVKSIIGTKLQVVLKDCNDVEVYRSAEGRSKYKVYSKSYQDALRKAFSGLEFLRVKQTEVNLLSENKTSQDLSTEKSNVSKTIETPNAVVKTPATSTVIIPEAKFSNYSYNGKSFLLRKTKEGFSLYEESLEAEDGLVLKGKLTVKDDGISYTNTSGITGKATFDSSGELKINDGAFMKIYSLEN